MIHVAVSGASGRMGQAIINEILNNPKLKLVAAFEKNDNPNLGKDAGFKFGKNTYISISNNINDLSKADCLIDFTQPQNTINNLKICAELGKKIVIGTTGFNEKDKNLINFFSKKTAIVLSPNMSIGINLIFKLLDVTSKFLGKDYDVEILEAHHKHKLDSPSGTALKMGEIIAASRNTELSKIASWESCKNNSLRKPGSIGFSCMRGGDISGEHVAYFYGPGEQIEIKHKSNDRRIYANGAIHAACFLADKKIGLYDMHAVLQSKNSL
ncbi:MAG: 4-hydroxy-tetrahydrodipicolinate reductase [Bordetella sp.]|nr:MAG: 4-hydroxy-tetrahydrodipicolinate reductase [Bordetella sp.]